MTVCVCLALIRAAGGAVSVHQTTDSLLNFVYSLKTLGFGCV